MTHTDTHLLPLPAPVFPSLPQPPPLLFLISPSPFPLPPSTSTTIINHTLHGVSVRVRVWVRRKARTRARARVEVSLKVRVSQGQSGSVRVSIKMSILLILLLQFLHQIHSVNALFELQYRNIGKALSTMLLFCSSSCCSSSDLASSNLKFTPTTPAYGAPMKSCLFATGFMLHANNYRNLKDAFLSNSMCSRLEFFEDNGQLSGRYHSSNINILSKNTSTRPVTSSSHILIFSHIQAKVFKLLPLVSSK